MEKILICIAMCFLVVSCNKQGSELSNVGTFIEILKENKIEKIEAPIFSKNDISELLNHRSDDLNISNFPRNPLSSFYMEEVAIGMYILWTIESIRMETINDPNFYLFASLNPRIIRIPSGELVNQDVILAEVAKAYLNWWNSSLSLEEKLQINPLEKLDLKWN